MINQRDLPSRVRRLCELVGVDWRGLFPQTSTAAMERVFDASLAGGDVAAAAGDEKAVDGFRPIALREFDFGQLARLRVQARFAVTRLNTEIDERTAKRREILALLEPLRPS